jgi:TonB-dependent receptor
MKRTTTMELAAGWLLSGVLLLAQIPETTRAAEMGAIEGRVLNAATGAYLNNARVTVRGTSLTALTDESGTYRLAGVAVGEAALVVTYTGLDSVATTVAISAGRVTRQDISISGSSRYGSEDRIVQLDAFKVQAAREMDAETIAINEQRVAPNIKNVISTDTIGDPMGGSMGDFLRFLPGVSADYTNTLETIGIMIRGFPSRFTLMSMDGAQFAGSSDGGGREFDASRLSANAFSRVEVTKVPLPSTPADTMAGSVNFVSKSAFERRTPELKYRIGFASTDQDFSLKRTQSQQNKLTYKIYPDTFLEYTRPISDRLGFVVTALHAVTANQTDQAYTEFRGVGVTGSTVTPATPVLSVVRENDRYRENTRDSLSFRVDWRPSRHGVLSVNTVVTATNELSYQSNDRIENLADARPTVAGGIPLSYTAERVEGATGRGNYAQNYNHFEKTGLVQSAGVRYRFDDGTWRLNSALNLSRSRATRTDVGAGFFQNVTVLARDQPLRVVFEGIKDGRPADFRFYSSANREIDVYDVNNLVISRAADGPDTTVRKVVQNANLDLRREFRRWPFPFALQAGGTTRSERNDDRRFDGRTYDYMGINGSFSAAPYLNDLYYTEQRKLILFPNKPPIPWISTHKVLAAFRANPRLFEQTVAQKRTTAVNEILNSKLIQETVSAAYVQAEARFLNNRLSIFTGTRFETTTDKGEGPLQTPDAVYVRNADGSFARTTAGARIRKPQAGAAGSVEEVALIYQERASKAERSYHGYYPSLHLNYTFSDHLILRAAYAKSYGRPNYSDIIPNTTVVEDDLVNDTGDLVGRITYTNPGLRPWTADNYDLSLEYYSASGGLLSAGVFQKDVTNFFGRYVAFATADDLRALGLDQQFLGWRVTTTFNAGAARVRGGEINLRHSLRPLGGWGRHLNLFANATKIRTEGNAYADFRGFLPLAVNWGVIYARDRYSILAKWNYRGEQKLDPVTTVAPDAFIYALPRLQMDLSLEGRVSKRVTLYCNIRNLSARQERQSAYGAATPAYGRPYYIGTFNREFSVGIKGSF